MSRNGDYEYGLEFDPETEQRVANEVIAAYDVQKKPKMASFFEDTACFEKAVKQKILPALFSIKTWRGVIGSGYFHHSLWMVSNAHVIQHENDFEDIQYTKYTENSQSFALSIKDSFLRPHDRHVSPDVVVANLLFRPDGSNSCLSNEFKEVAHPSDLYEEQSHLFYVELNIDCGGNYAIKFLKQRSKSGTVPLIYECIDATDPQPGSSGSPIIEARVVYSKHKPEWEFRVVTVLYARCSASWYNSNQSISTQEVSSSTKLVCAIPIDPEFEQILPILTTRETSTRNIQMAGAYSTLNDDAARQGAAQCLQSAQKGAEEAAQHYRRFKAGDTRLNIALPDGLEKLWYSGVVTVDKSLLIRANLDRELKGKAKRFYLRVSSVGKDDLQLDFENIQNKIAQEKVISLHEEDEYIVSENKYFRLDIDDQTSKNKRWQLDIQDNTGKDSKGIPLCSRKKSLSSVFARVYLQSDMESINGMWLADLFQESVSGPFAKTLTPDEAKAYQEKQISCLLEHVRGLFTQHLKSFKTEVKINKTTNSGQEVIVLFQDNAVEKDVVIAALKNEFSGTTEDNKTLVIPLQNFNGNLIERFNTAYVNAKCKLLRQRVNAFFNEIQRTFNFAWRIAEKDKNGNTIEPRVVILTSSVERSIKPKLIDALVQAFFGRKDPRGRGVSILLNNLDLEDLMDGFQQALNEACCPAKDHKTSSFLAGHTTRQHLLDKKEDKSPDKPAGFKK